MQQLDDLNKFLSLASGQREVALIIAQDEIHLRELERSLEEKGFGKAGSASELARRIAEPGKIFFTLTATVDKSAYDFVAQYPTGQVEIFDHSQMRSHVATPDYQGLSVAVLVTQQDLATLEGHGYGLRTHTGIAYQG